MLQCFLLLSPNSEAQEPLLTPSPLPKSKHISKSRAPAPALPPQTPASSPNSYFQPRLLPSVQNTKRVPQNTPARTRGRPYPGVAGCQPRGLYCPAGDGACSHHLRQDGSVIILLIIVGVPGTEVRVSIILREPSRSGVEGTMVPAGAVPPRTWSPHEAAPLSSATPPSGNWGDTRQVRC